MNVTVQNFGGSQVETRQLSDNEIIVMIDQKTAQASAAAPGMVAAELGKPNSKISKAIVSNMSTERRR